MSTLKHTLTAYVSEGVGCLSFERHAICFVPSRYHTVLTRLILVDDPGELKIHDLDADVIKRRDNLALFFFAGVFDHSQIFLLLDFLGLEDAEETEAELQR